MDPSSVRQARRPALHFCSSKPCIMPHHQGGLRLPTKNLLHGSSVFSVHDCLAGGGSELLLLLPTSPHTLSISTAGPLTRSSCCAPSSSPPSCEQHSFRQGANTFPCLRLRPPAPPASHSNGVRITDPTCNISVAMEAIRSTRAPFAPAAGLNAQAELPPDGRKGPHLASTWAALGSQHF